VGARTRIGFVVPRFKHTAVARNRLKRRLRELSRVHLLPADLSADMVLRIRPEAYGATFDELAADIARAFAQLTRWSEAMPPAIVPGSPTSPLP
jgi:ribonuclease P protein component